MKQMLILAIVGVSAVMLLTGCKIGGDDGSTASGSSSYSSSGGSSDVSSSVSSSSTPIALAHNPEPATMALLGGGFAAYMLMKRKRK